MKRILSIFITFCLCLGGISAGTLYMEKATASFYAEDFHGKKTSSGEPFDMNALTCANKYLPFGTILKVTNLSNGKSVEVRVNDRGPFVTDREIDLSKAAAQQLGMIQSGTATVRIEIISRPEHSLLSFQTMQSAKKIMERKTGKTVQVPAEAESGRTESASGRNNENSGETADGERWDIQLGAFSSRHNAEKLARSLQKAGFKNIVFQKTEKIIRVVIRDVSSENLTALESELEEKGFSEYTVRPRTLRSTK